MLGVAGPSGLPFPQRRESRMNEVKNGYPPTTAGMTGAREFPATNRGDDGIFGHARHLLSGIHLESLADGSPTNTAKVSVEAAETTKERKTSDLAGFFGQYFSFSR
jgi:hypothetical protein